MVRVSDTDRGRETRQRLAFFVHAAFERATMKYLLGSSPVHESDQLISIYMHLQVLKSSLAQWLLSSVVVPLALAMMRSLQAVLQIAIQLKMNGVYVLGAVAIHRVFLDHISPIPVFGQELDAVARNVLVHFARRRPNADLGFRRIVVSGRNGVDRHSFIEMNVAAADLASLQG